MKHLSRTIVGYLAAVSLVLGLVLATSAPADIGAGGLPPVSPPVSAPAPPPAATPSDPVANVTNCLVSNRESWALAGVDCVFGTQINVSNAQWTCNQPLANYGPLPIKVVFNFTTVIDEGDQGHLDLIRGCTGDGNSDTIDLIASTNSDGMTVGSSGGAAKFRTAGPMDIQVTGNFDCGPLVSLAHQDGWQFHPNHRPARLAIVNGTSGNFAAGTSTCIGAGGAVFWSNDYDVDVYGGEYVTCNKGFFGAGQVNTGNIVTGAKFRTGRVDGTDPRCTGFNATRFPCDKVGKFAFTNNVCQRWNASSKSWVNVAPRP